MRRILIVILAIALVFSFCAVSVCAADLEALPPDKRELEALVAEAQTFRRDQYEVSEEEWVYFLDKLIRAEEVLMTDYVYQTYVDNALYDLQYAISVLKSSEKSVDKNKLQQIIESAMRLEKQNYFISQTRWDEFQMAIYFANETLEDENARQIEVDDACESLRDWMLSLSQFEVGIGGEETDIATDVIIIESDIEKYPPVKDVIIPEEPKSTTSVWDGGVIELGCDASLAISALAIVGMIGAAALIKKKED